MERCTAFLSTVTLILVLTLIVAVIPTEKEGEIYEDTIRLHILANSNGADDQALKLEVRDRLLEKYGARLRQRGSKEEAERQLSTIITDIERDVNAWVSEAGFGYTALVSIGTEWYERREYGEYALPEGYYTSMRIELGDADGQNWWCVMYPPMCLDIATEDAPADDALFGYTEQEIALIGRGKYTLKFKLLELTSEIFAHRGK